MKSPLFFLPLENVGFTRVICGVLLCGVIVICPPFARSCDDEGYYYDEYISSDCDYDTGCWIDYFDQYYYYYYYDYSEYIGTWYDVDCSEDCTGGYCEGESCSCSEGGNPFNVYDGNARREVKELELPGTSRAHFNWTRFHNTVPRRGQTALGQGGSWRHSWQFELTLLPARNGHRASCDFISPAGMRRNFERADNGKWRPAARFPERLEEVTDGFDLITGSGVRLHFMAVAGDGPEGRRYEMRILTDAHGLETRLDYDDLGNVTKVTDPAGRFFEVTYRDIPQQKRFERKLAWLDSVAPGADGWVEVAVPAWFAQHQAFRYLRCVTSEGAPADIAETHYFAPGAAQPLSGVTIEEGATLDLGVARNIARVRVRPNPGVSLAGVTVSGLDARPASARVLVGVRASDGRRVDYAYETVKEAALGFEYPALSHARYGDGTTARYRYQQAANATQPLLVEADDPRYEGRAKRIQYVYRPDQARGLGFIHQEINPATGGVYASLELDPANPDKRVVHYSDLRSVSYLTPEATNGRPTERIDALGRKTRFEYGDDGRLQTRVDHAGRRTEFSYDEHGRVRVEQREGRLEKQTGRDALGRKISHTDRNGRARTYERDAVGRVIRSTPVDGVTREFARDALGRVISFKRVDGGVHTFAYNSRGLKISWTDHQGNVTRYGYDAQDRRISITDPIGRVTRREVNDRGLTTKLIHADGTTESFAYDDYGRKVASTDRLGRTTKFSYDELGRKIREEDAIGRVTTFDYTELPQGCGSCTLADHPSRIVGPDGVVTSLLYDAEGRLLARTVAPSTAAEATTLYAYDNDDNLVSQTDPLGHITRYTYDDDRHRLTATDPLGRVTKWGYDDKDRNTSIVTPDGGSTRFGYDALDRRISMTDAAGNTTSFAYNAAGRMTSLTDARGSTYRWEFDVAGRKTAMIYPDNSRETWTYDAIGRILASATRAGQIKTLRYDAKGRLASETWAANAAPEVTYTYTALGQVASLDNGLAKLDYTYDDFGRMVAETTTRAGHAPMTTRYGYDTSIGRRATVSYPSGAVVTQSYGPRGEVAAVMLDGAVVATFNYDLAGRRETVSRANGVQTIWNTDAAGQLRSIRHTLGDVTLASTTYELDVAGRRNVKTDESGWTERYGYDAIGQLTSAEYFDAPDARQSQRRVDYTYDVLGNRERMSEMDRAQRGHEKKILTHYSANNLNQYTRITVGGAADAPIYDANGNLTRAQGVEYRYDACNQLVEVTTATDRMTQVHDPKGRVVERQYFTKGSQNQWVKDDSRSLALVYDSAWNVIEDRSIAGALRARYVRGPRIDEILLHEGSDGAKLCPLSDGLNSTVALTGALGAVIQRYRYDAYGDPIRLHADYALAGSRVHGKSEFRFLFSSREWLGIAALQDNRHRLYSAKSGQWLQVDPIRFGSGQMNLMSYALNNPIQFTDPDGHCVVVAIPIGAVIIGGAIIVGGSVVGYLVVREVVKTVCSAWSSGTTQACISSKCQISGVATVGAGYMCEYTCADGGKVLGGPSNGNIAECVAEIDDPR